MQSWTIGTIGDSESGAAEIRLWLRLQGDKVKLTLQFKGREMQFQQIGRDMFDVRILLLLLLRFHPARTAIMLQCMRSVQILPLDHILPSACCLALPWPLPQALENVLPCHVPWSLAAGGLCKTSGPSSSQHALVCWAKAGRGNSITTTILYLEFLLHSLCVGLCHVLLYTMNAAHAVDFA